MKCTDIYLLNQKLRKLAVKELKQALEKVGGKYELTTTPVVTEYNDYVSQILVTNVELEDGYPHIYGEDLDACQDVEIYLEHLNPQDIFFIIENIGTNEDNVATPGVEEKIYELTSYLKSL